MMDDEKIPIPLSLANLEELREMVREQNAVIANVVKMQQIHGDTLARLIGVLEKWSTRIEAQ